METATATVASTTTAASTTVRAIRDERARGALTSMITKPPSRAWPLQPLDFFLTEIGNRGGRVEPPLGANEVVLDGVIVGSRGEEVHDLADMEQPGKKARDKKAKNQAKIYREAPIEATGTIAYSGDPTLDGPVKDAPQMLRRLAESDRVRQVFIRHVFRYFLGRNETPGDAVSLQEAEKAYLDNGGSFKVLLVSLLSSESFLLRMR
jgi:hypothetical protein